MAKTTTEWRKFDGGKYRMRVEYGFDTKFAREHNQDPYFSITGEIQRKGGKLWREDSCGQLHDEIRKVFPELAKYIPFHLCSTKGPMHYIPNAIYWAEKCAGISQWAAEAYDPNPFKAFKSTVIFGAVEGDELPDFEALAAQALEMAGIPDNADLSEDDIAKIQRANFGELIHQWCAVRLDKLLDELRSTTMKGVAA